MLAKENTKPSFEYVLAVGRSQTVQQWSILQLAIGDKDKVQLDIRALFETVLQRKVDCLLLCHNHPNGRSTPSVHDLSTTQRINLVCRALEVDLRDHIIFGSENLFSFRCAGYL